VAVGLAWPFAEPPSFSGAGVVVPDWPPAVVSSLASGTVAPGVAPASPGAGCSPVGGAGGVGVGVGAAVCAGGVWATCWSSSASSISASAMAPSASTSSVPTMMIGTRQRGVSATRAPTSAPQFRHHS
jgi:hypothetical protein